jgi:hypothetical protein
MLGRGPFPATASGRRFSAALLPCIIIVGGKETASRHSRERRRFV